MGVWKADNHGFDNSELIELDKARQDVEINPIPKPILRALILWLIGSK